MAQADVNLFSLRAAKSCEKRYFKLKKSNHKNPSNPFSTTRVKRVGVEWRKRIHREKREKFVALNFLWWREKRGEIFPREWQ